MSILSQNNLSGAALVASLFASHTATAVDLNYDSLSSLEEPIAFELGDTTFSVNGLIDSALSYGDESENDSFILGNFQIGAETQLPNSWTLGATYFGSYSSSDLDADDSYQDNAAIYLGGIWGTSAVGNVTGLVREQTRRARGVGNAELSFDDQLGQLDDYGISYSGRFGPNVFMIATDEDGGYELGASYQRPLGNKDYRFSLQYRDSKYTPDNEVTVFDSRGVGFVSELTFGSTVFDLGLGVEQLSFDSLEADRTYASFGVSHKIGAWSASAEAHLGQIESQDERSYALGLRYDIARGLSLNLGANYTDAIIDVGTIRLLDDSDTVGTASLRYSF